MKVSAVRAAPRNKIALHPSVVRLLPPIGVGVAYYVAARLSLHLALVGKSVTPLWPSTGIALVGFLWFGYRCAPAVTVAAFLVNWRIGPSAEAAAWISAGNTIAPAGAAWLLSLVDFRQTLDRTKDALALVALAALASMTLSATVGTFALRHFDVSAHHDFWSTWAVWWAGDAVGILAIAPFLMGLRSIKVSRPIGWSRIAEACLLFGALATVAGFIFGTQRHFLFAIFPLLVWIVWRFGQLGAGPAALLVIVMASWAAAHNSGPFEGADLLPKMLVLQTFDAAVALLSFFFAAVVSERADARRQLESSVRELYQREHRIATTLQQSLLPDELPTVPDIEVTARYIPATTEAEVGGDWYDIIQLADGRLGVAIGDVAGHGVAAAAIMGQLRMALRAYGLQGLRPSEACARLNVLLTQIRPGTMATLAFGHVDPDAGTFTLVKAGHPPPLLLDGRNASYIEGGLGPPLGITPSSSYEETTVELPFGSTLVLYTDGLIERRGESLERGLERLAAAAVASPLELDAAGDYIVRSVVGPESFDDTAILAIRRRALADQPLVIDIPAEPSRLVWVRQVLRRWLRQNGAGDSDVAEINLACTEACANAIQHAYRAREGRLVIEGMPDRGQITLSIRDFGRWRDPVAAPRNEGNGIALMKGLMDSVSLKSGAEGTEVRMTRRVGSMVNHG